MGTSQETTFFFAERSGGTLSLPDQDAPAPAVVLLHGFASHADEVGGFYARLAEALVNRGIASLRFTFRNFERLPDEPVDSSIPAMLAEAEAARRALSAHPDIDGRRVGLLGFSLGGAVAVLSAAGAPAHWRTLATWSCAADLERSFRRSVGDAAFDRALAGEDLDLDLGWCRIRLRPGLFQSMVRVYPEEDIRSWDGPFLAITGSEDPLAHYLDIYVRNAGGKVKEKLLVPGADHIFNVLEDPARFLPGVIEKTVAWFARTLGD